MRARGPRSQGLGWLRPRLGPARLRSCPRGDAASSGNGNVSCAGAVPAGVGDGGPLAERIRASAELAGGGPARGRERARCRADHAGSADRTCAAGRVGSLDVVGPGDGERFQWPAQGRLLDGRQRVHRLPRRGPPPAVERVAGVGRRAQSRRCGRHADERAVVCALAPAAGVGGMGLVRRGLGRPGPLRRGGQSQDGPGDVVGGGRRPARSADVVADRSGAESGCVSDGVGSRGRRPPGCPRRPATRNGCGCWKATRCGRYPKTPI